MKPQLSSRSGRGGPDDDGVGHPTAQRIELAFEESLIAPNERVQPPRALRVVEHCRVPVNTGVKVRNLTFGSFVREQDGRHRLDTLRDRAIRDTFLDHIGNLHHHSLVYRMHAATLKVKPRAVLRTQETVRHTEPHVDVSQHVIRQDLSTKRAKEIHQIHPPIRAHTVIGRQSLATPHHPGLLPRVVPVRVQVGARHFHHQSLRPSDVPAGPNVVAMRVVLECEGDEEPTFAAVHCAQLLRRIVEVAVAHEHKTVAVGAHLAPGYDQVHIMRPPAIGGITRVGWRDTTHLPQILLRVAGRPASDVHDWLLVAQIEKGLHSSVQKSLPPQGHFAMGVVRVGLVPIRRSQPGAHFVLHGLQ